jgi:hypothetical protein
MMSSRQDFDVAIIGAGPVGAYLANLLGMAGLHVLLVDREFDIYQLPRAVHFDGEVMRAFQAAGLADTIAKIARASSMGMHFVSASGQTLLVRRAYEGVGPHDWAGNYYVHQPHLEVVLRDDLRRLAIVALNLAAYQKYLQPWIKGMVKPQAAEMMRNLHPLRLQYEAFSSKNPFMAMVKSLAERVSEDRKQVSTDNPFVAFQEQFSKQIVNALDSWRDAQEALSEATFLAVYGSPALQAAVGVDPQSTPSRRQEMSASYRGKLERRIAELKSKISEGGLREAAIRGLLYVGSARGMVDERSLEALRNVRRSDFGARLTLTEFKMLVREQFFMLLLDQEGALAAIPKLLPDNAKARQAAFAAIREVLSASAVMPGEVVKRLKRVAELFGVDAGDFSDKASKVAPFDPKAKAS